MRTELLIRNGNLIKNNKLEIFELFWFLVLPNSNIEYIFETDFLIISLKQIDDEYKFCISTINQLQFTTAPYMMNCSMCFFDEVH